MWLAPAGAQDVPYVPLLPWGLSLGYALREGEFPKGHEAMQVRGLSLGYALREGEFPKGHEAMQVRGLSLGYALREGEFPKGYETMQALAQGGRVTRA